MRQTLKIAKDHSFITELYDMDEGWQMLITLQRIEAEGTWHPYAEAWIKKEDYGIMSLMFGSDLQVNDQSLDDFIEMAYYNFDDYKSDLDIIEEIVETHWRTK